MMEGVSNNLPFGATLVHMLDHLFVYLCLSGLGELYRVLWFSQGPLSIFAALFSLAAASMA